jgi:hypothetical protein
VKRANERYCQKAAIDEKRKSFGALEIAPVTISAKLRIIAKKFWSYISTGNAGVPSSRKRNTKRSINSKTKEEKGYMKTNFTMLSQKCEENGT